MGKQEGILNLRRIVYQEHGEDFWRFRIESEENGKARCEIAGIRLRYDAALAAADKARMEVQGWYDRRMRLMTHLT